MVNTWVKKKLRLKINGPMSLFHISKTEFNNTHYIQKYKGFPVFVDTLYMYIYIYVYEFWWQRQFASFYAPRFFFTINTSVINLSFTKSFCLIIFKYIGLNQKSNNNVQGVPLDSRNRDGQALTSIAIHLVMLKLSKGF